MTAAGIRKALESDAQAICEIYNPHVASTTVTFEQEPVSVSDMRARIREIGGQFSWLVSDSPEGVLGYAYATRWRSRAAYDRTVETTIYVRDNAMHSGVGYPLYMALLEELRRQSLHAAVGCIALPNPGSIAFHEKCGFRKVAHFREVGRKFDRWVDVGFWQVLL